MALWLRLVLEPRLSQWYQWLGKQRRAGSGSSQCYQLPAVPVLIVSALATLPCCRSSTWRSAPACRRLLCSTAWASAPAPRVRCALPPAPHPEAQAEPCLGVQQARGQAWPPTEGTDLTPLGAARSRSGSAVPWHGHVPAVGGRAIQWVRVVVALLHG